MEKESLKEPLLHGTAAFPLAVYPMIFPKYQHSFAYLHYHTEFELLVATRGTLLVQIEEQCYTVPEGEGIFINSGLLHTITAPEEEPAGHGFLAVVFDYSLLCTEQEAAFRQYIQPLLLGAFELNPRLSVSACDLVRSICSMYESSAFGRELFIKHCLLHIFYLLVKDVTPGRLSLPNTKSTLVKETLDYIKQHYAEPVSLQQLADHVHVSREYLCRTFHTLSGSSPLEYLNRYRIRQSTFLLARTNQRISDIALACGFNHSSYFGKLFFQYMGCTPTQYRKQKLPVPPLTSQDTGEQHQ